MIISRTTYFDSLGDKETESGEPSGELKIRGNVSLPTGKNGESELAGKVIERYYRRCKTLRRTAAEIMTLKKSALANDESSHSLRIKMYQSVARITMELRIRRIITTSAFDET